MIPELKPGQIYFGGEVRIGDVRLQGGDFIGRDQINNYQISVNILQGTDKHKSYWNELRKYIRPYIPDRPFSTLESELFTGRKAEIENLNQQINDPEKTTLAIYGPPDVGKTSLITAGVMGSSDEQASFLQ